MIKTAIDAMLKKLDPYTVYIPESKMEDYKFMTTGQYGGIGAMIRKDGEYVVISEPYEDFPAAKSGLRAGDVILKIDQIDVKGKSTEAMSELLKGEPGSSFVMQIQRPGQSEVLDINIEREKIKIKSVPYYGLLNDSVGYFLLTNFTQSAFPEVKEAVKSLVDQGAKSLIFDLRGNPGGLLIQSVNIVNLFVEKGEDVVFTKGRVSQWDKHYKTQNASLHPDIPMCILVNSGSASASEIVSGSMQDLDRAVIIGSRTFGKGLVQTTRPLSYNAQLKVTTAKYYIPSGRCIQALDYSHRNEDGSVGKVPDSLITEYQTKNKRSVFDGGGIVPDIDVEAETLSNIAFNLVAKSLIFDYATEYRQKYDSITDAKSYVFGEKDYEDFKNWLSTKDLEYDSESEYQLDKLIEIAKKENYFEHSKAQFETLKTELANDKEKDLRTFKSQIIRLIEQEIVTRYYYQRGSIENMIAKDSTVLKAIEILKDTSIYNQILSGKYAQGNIKISEEKSNQ
jgi:carboxyl-terminal processing protease